MVNELKFLGSAADESSLWVTFSDFHVLFGCSLFCWKFEQKNKTILLIVSFFLN